MKLVKLFDSIYNILKVRKEQTNLLGKSLNLNNES